MSGIVGINGRTFPEWWVWAIAGFLGTFTPLAGLSLAMWIFAPIIGVVLVGGLAYFTWSIRAGVRARTVRVWAAATWVILVGMLPTILIHLVLPDGTSWPPANLIEVATWIPAWIATFVSVSVVPAAIAAGAFETGRRRLWNSES